MSQGFLPRDILDQELLARDVQAEGRVPAWRRALRRAEAALHARFGQGELAGNLIRWRSGVIDGLIEDLWHHQDWNGDHVAVVAVGGYGRGELHPHSDVDLLVLTLASSPGCAPAIEGMITALWDVGLKLGHSVRTVEDCVDLAASDLTVMTGLLEGRLLLGDAALWRAVVSSTERRQLWPARAFFGAKRQEQLARHEKFADTEYNLEPNVKGSPGGLRDLQLIDWLARRQFGWNSARELKEHGFLTEDEARTILEGQEFMWRVRYALHMITGREEDRLLFDHQRVLARIWGFADGETLAVEQFMQVYYRWAMILSVINEVLVQSFAEALPGEGGGDRVIPINNDFGIRNGFIEALRDDIFRDTPSNLLYVFWLCAQEADIRGINANTIRLLRQYRHLVDADFRNNSHHRHLFIDILRSPHGVTRQLRRMARYGILGNYLPEFGRVIGQMQHDLFHAYTVDAHTLQVIENMRRLQRPEFAERFPVASRIARRLPKKELLYVAGLYHDIGKGRGGDHSELGAVDAERFCQDHGIGKRDTNTVVWLVRNHLLMSAVAQRKDISDPDVIQRFAAHVGDEERLDYLFALTVADIHGTNPTLWNAWRGSLLRQLYTAAKRALRRGLENPVDKKEWVAETRRAAADLLEFRGFTGDELERLWSQRGEEYFLRERAEDIAWHTEAIANHFHSDAPLVLVRNSADSSVANATQIFVYARSNDSAFTRMCLELEQLDLSIHDARIYNASDGMTLDTFFVLDSSGRSIESESDRLRHICEHLTAALRGARPRLRGSRRTSRQIRSFRQPTQTEMSLDSSQGVSVLEVATPDRPGLLARIAEVFQENGVLLQAAKIQTLGERVEDVFFITDSDHRPIVDAAASARIQDSIRRVLDEQQAA